jgi:diguanylate cyclase (GGDEF)-like protein
MVIVGILLILINIFLGISLSRLVIGPIKVFNKAAGAIADGSLDLRVKIHTDDELEELAKSFNYMTAELVKMKARAENANPLTKLPGNIVIMEEVERLIKEDKKFTVVYADLDNFKAFNDKYGIHKGDEAITMTGNIFKEAIKNKGNESDFVGHEGGDDFIILTSPESAEAVTDYITHNFDERVKSLYNKEDLDRGHIVAHSREGEVKKFPIMTISLAGVTNQYRPISNYSEITNIVAEVKKKAKNKDGSCFVLDKRER